MTDTAVTGLYGADATDELQRDALTTGQVPVAVYGLGKMGLPLAAVYAGVTGNVTGVDIDETVVASLNRGECHVPHEPDLPELVARLVEAGAFTATTDAVGAAERAAIHVVIVPTEVTPTKEPELAALESVVDTIAAGLTPGDVVILESTVPPGVCADVVKPTLVAQSGLDAGSFGVAFCPERTASGRALRDIRGAYPKVVGGVDAESTRVARLVYQHITDNEVIPVSDATTAEAVKLFEGLYRDVNIALANELARIRDDLEIDVREAIDTANTLPLCDIHVPGVGVGGHCIPYYPHFVMATVETEMPLVATARQVNESMPAFAVARLVDGLCDVGLAVDEATVAVLGVGYRPDVAEVRATPARPVIDDLRARGADVLVVDPVVDAETLATFDAEPVSVGDLTERALDAVVLVTAHSDFDRLDWTAFEPLVVVDGRDALTLDETNHRVYTIGRG